MDMGMNVSEHMAYKVVGATHCRKYNGCQSGPDNTKKQLKMQGVIAS